MKTNFQKDKRKAEAIIVDDEMHCLEEFKNLLSEFTDINLLEVISDPLSAANIIIEKNPDLLFLDIQMPGKDGFEVLDSIRRAGMEPFVIFVTAYDEYAIRAIRNAAFDYLIKPVCKNELTVVLDRFREAFMTEKRNADYVKLLENVSVRKKVMFNTTGGFILIDYDDIVFIKADWNYSEVHVSKDKYELVTQNLGTVEKQLYDHSFFRINRSIIINLAYLTRVKRLTRTCILKKGDEGYQFNIPLNKIRLLEQAIKQ
ncbi:MAG: LytTR family DNA-binding domain-containing protein [Bacteroidales bacterium]|nr:LytTR family DNA-binding domain-containing protein [Bacteroidales bacterium]